MSLIFRIINTKSVDNTMQDMRALYHTRAEFRNGLIIHWIYISKKWYFEHRNLDTSSCVTSAFTFYYFTSRAFTSIVKQ